MSTRQYSLELRVFYEDMDSSGVVYHANYLRFMERCRTEWLRAVGFDVNELAEREGIVFAVRSAVIDFLRPALLSDLLTVSLAVTRLGRLSMMGRQEVRRGNELLCTGALKLASLDAGTFKPRPIPFPMENAIKIAASTDNISIISLIAHASLLVQLVMLGLLLASVLSWTMIFSKHYTLRGAVSAADQFEDDFWSGGDMGELFSKWSSRRKPVEGMANIFIAGYREYTRLSKKQSIERGEMVDGVQRAMRVAMNREVENLETHLSFLATVGSTSPYVGLFGTVWGIMNSFRALGTAQHATISSVAPGIAEALIATAMGLFAAIPAVIAYNRYSNKVERLVARYETFGDEFVSIVSRQSYPIRMAS